MSRSLLFVLVMAAACSKSGGNSEPPEPAASPTTQPAAAAPSVAGDPAAKAKEIFATRCTPCHGATGTGDGPASASLNPKPRAFAEPAWQDSVTDDHLVKIIKFGGAAVGKSAAMPSNPDLTDDKVLAELAKIVRGFRK